MGKETPIKVVFFEGKPHCSACVAQLFNEHQRYCHWCGHALIPGFKMYPKPSYAKVLKEKREK